MAVYFEPGSGKSWIDYAMPIVAAIIGNGMNRSNQAKEYELAKRTADEEMARERQMAQWRAEQLYGTEKTRPLSGGEQAMNVAGYLPGGPAPAMDERYREGGVLNGLDMRGDPNDAFARMSAGMSYMNPEAVKQIQHIIGNLNPNMSFQSINQGDRVTAGGFDPNSGEFGGQEYGAGIDPSIRYAQNAMTGREKMSQAGQNYRLGLEMSQPKPAQVSIGPNGEIMFVDPYKGTVTDSGYKPRPAPAAMPAFGERVDLIRALKSGSDGGESAGTLQSLAGMGGNSAEAAPNGGSAELQLLQMMFPELFAQQEQPARAEYPGLFGAVTQEIESNPLQGTAPWYESRPKEELWAPGNKYPSDWNDDDIRAWEEARLESWTMPQFKKEREKRVKRTRP